MPTPEAVVLVDEQGLPLATLNAVAFSDGNWNVDVCAAGAKFLRSWKDGNRILNTEVDATLVSVASK